MQYLAFKKGETQGEIEIIGETDHTGTIINFKPDPEIFTETIEFDYDILKNRLRELAFLNRQLTITLEDKREENKKDRKSTRLNSSHVAISYAVFCLKKKKKKQKKKTE